jgi:AcrR family transcriptional regulator
MFRRSSEDSFPGLVTVAGVLSRRDQNREATRRALFAAGRRLFIQRGYVETSIDEIVRAARVTKGAFYYHFKDKKDLFRVVMDELNAGLTKRVTDSSLTARDPWDGIIKGVEAFLDYCLDPAYQRIVVLDGPAVMEADEWREIAEGHGLGLIRLMSESAMKQGIIERLPVAPLAHLLHGALHEGALYIATSADPKRARREVGKAALRIVEGLRSTQ